MGIKDSTKRIGGFVSGFIQGRFLVDERIRRHYPFVLFLALLAAISIYSSHAADKKVHRISELRKDLKDLSSDYIDTRSKLMEASIESKVIERAEEIHLIRKNQPPVIIKSPGNGE